MFDFFRLVCRVEHMQDLFAHTFVYIDFHSSATSKELPSIFKFCTEELS